MFHPQNGKCEINLIVCMWILMTILQWFIDNSIEFFNKFHRIIILTCFFLFSFFFLFFFNCYFSNCNGVILPSHYGEQIKGKEEEFCPRCECKYENRNTAIIKVVVIIVIWIISLLVVYMLFLICLDPLLNKRIKNSYQEHTNEDVCAND